jgi:hypothetical protein
MNTNFINNVQCRFCENPTFYKFCITGLNEINISYFECTKCKSLQTEYPYWIDSAYAVNISIYDTGAAQRNLNNLSAVYVISKILNVKNIIDFGGGDGLLCRLLRDVNINCFSQDAYSTPIYSQGFTDPDFLCPDLVTAFEVVEHLVNPKIDLDEIFLKNSEVVLITTETYGRNDKEWWYLCPESGQHIFFYSNECLDLISKKYKYNIYRLGSYTLFIKQKMPKLKEILIKLIFKKPILMIVLSFIVLKSKNGINNDLYKLKKNRQPKP